MRVALQEAPGESATLDQSWYPQGALLKPIFYPSACWRMCGIGDMTPANYIRSRERSKSIVIGRVKLDSLTHYEVVLCRAGSIFSFDLGQARPIEDQHDGYATHSKFDTSPSKPSHIKTTKAFKS